MRVLAACSLGGSGHLNPLLPLLDAARRRGDEVLVIGPPALSDMVKATGHSFRAGGEPAEDEVAPIRERLPIAPPREASVLGNRELFGRLAATAMLPAMEQTFAEWFPDLVLRDPCEYASAVVAHRLAVPTAQIAISLAEAEMGSIMAASPALEEHRSGLVKELMASPYLTSFPPALDPSPFPSTIRFHDDHSPATGPLPDWWGGSPRPLVYVTFGTVLGHMSIAAGVYRTALKALGLLEVRALLTVGRRFDVTGLGPIPTNVHVESWVDHDRVLAAAELVVCHGGSGTVLGAIAAALPLVVVPVFADQFENGRRIAGQGAGRVVQVRQSDGQGRAVIGEDDAPRIAEAITTVLHTPSYRLAARRLASEMATSATVDEALHRVLR